MSGFIMVNRVPGNFHVEAQSKHHNINGALTNVSHIVNSLSFGSQFPTRNRVSLGVNSQLEGMLRMEAETFTTDVLHSAPHHYIKVTHCEIHYIV
jgi:Endoplasmic reticulum vesicle transporter